MDKYTIYCTEEQTKKALELGAPLRIIKGSDEVSIKAINAIANGKCKNEYTFIDNFQQPGEYWCKLITNPTAEQMIGWLEEQGFEFYTYKPVETWMVDVANGEFCTTTKECASRKEATLAAIDVALDYLINNSIK